ncbi:MAG: HAE1 family hydrophobic/amphiphilic exporter-1 [Chlamydiales bacterium]|jgi:HAE1 family hydrophobic/amphiphilic exporter-1
MNLIATAIRQPVTVLVGVLLIVLSGIVALQRIPIQLTPNVEDTIIAVTTYWEGASPQEIEQEIVDPQEDKLQGISNLKEITSKSQQSSGTVRLQFAVGTPKEVALREVSDKLREVSSYPVNADEPVVEASDPDSRDYIAWLLLESTDPTFDVRTLQDFADDRIKPTLERLAGMAEINALGGREREVQIRFDPARLAQHGLTIPSLVAAIRGTNRNVSAGALEENKSNVRVRLVSQYERVEEVASTVIAQTSAGPVFLRDVAEVLETYKEPNSFVRSRGRPIIAINAQKEVGANVMEVMALLRAALEEMNAPGGLLDTQARELQLDGTLHLAQGYDQTVYIDDALSLVQSNIWIGGAIAIGVLLLFLRSLRPAGIVALAIPISVVGAIVVMVAMGRTVNVISLAGMAFAVGMVVDNAIVVLENIYRHLELGKPPAQAALDGTREVFGAVLASTLTTVAVFIPILLIEEEAGQLFRDIALAIVAAVSLSLLVAVTVIPSCAARLLRRKPASAHAVATDPQGADPIAVPGRVRRSGPSDWIAALVYRMCGSVVARLVVVVGLTLASIVGTWQLMPPADYLPQGNRNLIFGLIVPPPGYSLTYMDGLAQRVESTIQPYWEAGSLETGSPEYEQAEAQLGSVPTFDFARMQPGPAVRPPPLTNYFAVSFDGIMFHGGIGSDPARAVDIQPLFQHATRGDVLPGVMAFAFQLPLFQLGGSTGSAVKINFSGDDLGEVARAAESVFLDMLGTYGGGAVQPDPSNFNISGPELRVRPDLVRLGEVGMSPDELGLSVRALGDGAVIGDYRSGGQTIDLKLVAQAAQLNGALNALGDTPLATPLGGVVPLSALATLTRVNAPFQINREGRRRAVTLQFTAPTGMPLERAVEQIDTLLEEKRAAGVIPRTVGTSFTGSASKLAAVREAMLGDGTVAGTLTSSLVLALIVVYLLMCVLFQSFVQPLIILFSVPLATLGGFAALFGMFLWSQVDRYLPVQNLDVLTMLGFVILIGVVVNNAILIVHQAHNFMGAGMESREAIRESVRSRVRPIFMSTLTSVGGMAPLVFMPGSGSELYRGLGSVVLGGLLVSTVFTLLLVPLLLSLSLEIGRARRAVEA